MGLIINFVYQIIESMDNKIYTKWGVPVSLLLLASICCLIFILRYHEQITYAKTDIRHYIPTPVNTQLLELSGPKALEKITQNTICHNYIQSIPRLSELLDIIRLLHIKEKKLSEKAIYIAIYQDKTCGIWISVSPEEQKQIKKRLQQKQSSGFNPVTENHGKNELYHYILPDGNFLHCYFGTGVFGCSHYIKNLLTPPYQNKPNDTIPAIKEKGTITLLSRLQTINYFSPLKTENWYIQDMILQSNQIWLTGYLPKNTFAPTYLKNRFFQPKYFSKYSIKGIQIGFEYNTTKDTVQSTKDILMHSIDNFINIAFTRKDSLTNEAVIILPLKKPELLKMYFKDNDENSPYRIPKIFLNNLFIPDSFLEEINFGVILDSALYISKDKNSLESYLYDITTDENIEMAPDLSTLFKEIGDTACIFSFGINELNPVIPVFKDVDSIPAPFFYMNTISKEPDGSYYNTTLLTTIN